MRESTKQAIYDAIIAFIVCAAFGLLLVLIAKWYALNYLNKRLDAYFIWLLGITGSMVTLLFRTWTRRLNKVIDEKADKSYVDEKIKDEKENVKNQFKQIHEFMACMDHKLDILIGKKK